MKAELSSSSQGYARLPASRCVPALARGREAGALGEGAKLSESRSGSSGMNGLNILLLNLPVPIVQGEHIACMMGS